MTPEEFLKKKGYYAGSLMLFKTKGQGLVSIAQAMQEYADQQLILHGVVKSLPTKKELDSRLEMLITNNFEADENDGKKEYGFGFRACYRWIFSQVKQK